MIIVAGNINAIVVAESEDNMEKFRFTYTYDVVVEAFNEVEAVGKAANVLGTVGELSLKLWLVTHSHIKPVIESSGDFADPNDL